MAGENGAVPREENIEVVDLEGEGFQQGRRAELGGTTGENLAYPAPGGPPGGGDSVTSAGIGTGNGGGGALSKKPMNLPPPSPQLPPSGSGGASGDMTNEKLQAARQRYLRENVTSISQSSKSSGGSGDAGSARTFKRMLESVKKLEGSADKLHERVCQLHCQFGNVILKGSYLFDPSTIEIMTSKLGPDGQSEDEGFMRRQAVDEEYQSLIRRLEERPPTPATGGQRADGYGGRMNFMGN